MYKIVVTIYFLHSNLNVVILFSPSFTMHDNITVLNG